LIDPPDLIPSDTPGLPPEPKKLYLAMEFIPGSDLSAQVNGEPLAISRVLELVIQITEGLEAAHAANVVHRDLKPANVRVTPEGHVKILDFGLAAVIPTSESGTDDLHSSQHHIIGTWHFMSPEQTRGRTIDPRSDLFSLGTIVYLLVTGRLPFTGEASGEVADAIRHEEPPPMARYANHVPDELERIVRKLHAKDPNDRFQSAHEVRTDLVRLKRGLVPPPWPPGLQALLLAIGSVLALILAFIVIRIFVRPPPLAVVPFTNNTGDLRLDYLGNGLAADLNGSLIRNSHLSVAGVLAMQAIPPERRTPKDLAHELGVGAVLAGSFNKHNDQLNLDVELMKAPKGRVVWAASYDYDLAAGDEVARQIVRDVVYKLSGPLGGQRPLGPMKPLGSAYDRVLRASSALSDPDDASGPDRALAYLAQALEQDPDFALAWAWRSRALWKLYDRDKAEGSLRLAEEAADRAVHLNPELLEARLARAQVYRATSNYDASISELLGVLRVNPNWDEAELQLAAAYRDAGKLKVAEMHFLHATQVRPSYWGNWRSLGDLRYQQLGDYPGAHEAYDMVIRLVPEKNIGYTRQAAVETSTGHYDAAIVLYDHLPNPVQDASTATNMATLYFFMHQLEKAKRLNELAVRLEPRQVAAWMNLGDVHTRAGRSDSAHVCYENALKFADDQLHMDPRNRKLCVQRIQCLAKLGHCDEVRAAHAADADTLATGNAELTHRLAKAYAVCGWRAEALASVKRAVELGISPAVMRAEDEFAALVKDPAFPN
jgi:tetratricopeptide (TPR) repeat protein